MVSNLRNKIRVSKVSIDTIIYAANKRYVKDTCNRQRCLGCNIDLSLARLTMPIPMNPLAHQEQIHLVYRSLAHRVHQIGCVVCTSYESGNHEDHQIGSAPLITLGHALLCGSACPPDTFLESTFRSVYITLSTSNEFERLSSLLTMSVEI